MHNVRFLYILAIPLTQLLPHAFAIVPIPKAPDVPNVPRPVSPVNPAEEGTSGTAGGSSLGEDEGESTTGGTSGGLHPGASTSGGTTHGTNDKEGIGEVFEKVLDIIKESLPDSGDGSSTASITPAPIPTSQVSNGNARACLQANSIYTGCSAQTSDFNWLSNTSYQASCLCYWTSNGMVRW